MLIRLLVATLKTFSPANCEYARQPRVIGSENLLCASDPCGLFITRYCLHAFLGVTRRQGSLHPHGLVRYSTHPGKDMHPWNAVIQPFPGGINHSSTASGVRRCYPPASGTLCTRVQIHDVFVKDPPRHKMFPVVTRATRWVGAAVRWLPASRRMARQCRLG